MSESAERKEKFTPGPWEVKDNAEWDEILVLGKSSLPFGELRVAVIGQEEEEGLADAALIAAAPDMYAALEAYVSESRCLDPIRTPLPNPEGYASKVECTPCGKCTFCRARSALAKARGEA